MGENRGLALRMRILKFITVAALLLATQLPALGAELAVLRNGFSIRFEHKEQTGDTVRLYTGSGYIDVARDQIAPFEAEEAPVPAPAQPAAAPTAALPSTTTVDLVSTPASVPKIFPPASSAINGAKVDL